jgi:hypothetical protein
MGVVLDNTQSEWREVQGTLKRAYHCSIWEDVVNSNVVPLNIICHD